MNAFPTCPPPSPIWINGDKTRMVVLAEVVYWEYKERGHYAGEGRWEDYLHLTFRTGDEIMLYGYDATTAHRALVEYYDRLNTPA